MVVVFTVVFVVVVFGVVVFGVVVPVVLDFAAEVPDDCGDASTVVFEVADIEEVVVAGVVSTTGVTAVAGSTIGLFITVATNASKPSILPS